MTRRVAAAAVALAAIVLVGRWEGDRLADKERRGLDDVRREVGSLDSPGPTQYRLEEFATCLVYGPRELCFDNQGRLIEAVDRTNGTRRYDVRWDPDETPDRVDPRLVERLWRRLAESAQ